MIEKPILFNTKMVRAIMDGKKTCTRRVIKHNTEKVLDSPYHMEHSEMEDAWLIRRLCRAPYEPGDILYVRETWCDLPVNKAGHMRGHSIYYYKADGDLRPEGWRGNWRPSIHMPKEAARIWLKVTDVRVERLQDITENGIKNEGIRLKQKDCVSKFDYISELYFLFSRLWDLTIKKSDIDYYGWQANPWVWVIDFERCGKMEAE